MKELFYPSTFASDNFSGIHPEVLDAIKEANQGHAMAYGGDPLTAKATELFKKFFGPDAEAYLVMNGTAANVCTLTQMMSSWEAILCPETAHVWTDECGAASVHSGCTLVPTPSFEGKIDLAKVEPFLHSRGFEHHVQIRALYITQSTELGTVYSLEELKKIAAFAKENELYFFMDGARICNAAVTLGVTLKELTTDIGVDVLSFGGTKNGLMGADAVVFLKKGLSENFKYVRKQRLQLASKMRFVSAQFMALLSNDLWKRNAAHSNKMAKYLEMRLRKEFPQFPILYPVQANALFVQLPQNVLKTMQEKFFFWIWDFEKSVARWMTTWDTEEKFIDAFLSELKKTIS